MIAMPVPLPAIHIPLDELNENLEDILADVEKKALVSLDGKVEFSLRDKIVDGKLYVEQGIIAGCAGGGFENTAPLPIFSAVQASVPTRLH